MTTEKFCKDCTHWRDSQFSDFGNCLHPSNFSGPNVCLIDGSKDRGTLKRDPYDLRYTEDKELCGKSGAWWQQKATP